MRGLYPLTCRTLLAILAIGWAAMLFLLPAVMAML